jgi:hypothetical protein
VTAGWSMDAKLEMTKQWIMRADDDLRLAELIRKEKEVYALTLTMTRKLR